MELGSLTDWLTLVAGGFAFVVGYRQYLKAESWKRAEFLAGEMKAFFADPDVARALIFIDYSKIRLNEFGRPSDQGDVFDDAIITQALAIHTEFENGIESFSREQMVARAAWDALFTGFERFNSYVRSQLISTDDLKPYLDYWIRKVGVLDPEWKDPAFFIAVHKFVDHYGYVGVRQLFDDFNVRRPPDPRRAITSSS